MMSSSVPCVQRLQLSLKVLGALLSGKHGEASGEGERGCCGAWQGVGMGEESIRTF